MRSIPWKRTATSLAIVLATYWLYALFVVPRIEPPAPQSLEQLGHAKPSTPRATDRFQAELAGLFPEGAWENTSPKILRHRNTILLFRDYRPQEDGTLRIQPCTIVFRNPRQGNPDLRDQSSTLVLQAPEGAILQLSKPVDSQNIQLGEPVKGHLLGKIHISCPGKPDGTGRMQLLCSDVRINEQRLWTPNEVDWQFERSRARGRDLMIKLMPTDRNRDPGLPQGWAGIRSVELIHLDELHLDIVDAASTKDPAPAKSTPVDVACQGPVRVNFLENLMTFEDDVHLRRQDEGGAIDTLDCQRLMLYLAHPQSAAGAGDKETPAAIAQTPTNTPPASGQDPAGEKRSPAPRSLPKLELQRVVAEGNPVILDAVSRRAQVRGRKLLYDLKAGRYRVWADADLPSDQAWLQFQQQQIAARELDCQLEGPRTIRRVRAIGPGAFHGQLTGEEAQPLRAQWKSEMLLEREQSLYRLTLADEADVELADTHQIRAHMLHLWLEPLANQETDLPIDGPANRASEDLSGNLTGERPQFRPRQLIALADPTDPSKQPVFLRSESTTAVTERLDATFHHIDPAPLDRPSPQARQDRPSVASPKTRPASQSRPNGLARAGRDQFPNARDSSSPLLARNRVGSGGDPVRISSQQMQAVLRMDGSRMELEDIKLQNRVEIAQFPARDSSPGASPSQPAFQLRADRVFMAPSRDPAHPVMVAEGSAVEIESPQMLLQTTRLELDRSANLVSTEKPGRMFVMVDRDANGQPLVEPQKVSVTWQRHMDFNGRFVRFGGQIDVRSPDQRVRSELLEIRLDRDVRFDGPNQSRSGPVTIEEVTADGNVRVQTDQYVDGALNAQTSLQVPFAQINRLNGQVRAGGPGRLVTVRNGFHNGLSMPGARPAGPTAPDNSLSPVASPALPRLRSQQADGGEKTFLQVDYQGRIEGNLNERIVHFQDHVHVVYGPVMSWNETLQPQGALRKNDVLLSCQRLTLAQGQPGSDGRATFDLQAQGNTYVEGQTFTARGERVSYEQAKDLLVLEGTERTDAVLSHQARVGAARSEQVARKILYWPGTGRVDVDDARYLDLGNLGL